MMKKKRMMRERENPKPWVDYSELLKPHDPIWNSMLEDVAIAYRAIDKKPLEFDETLQHFSKHFGTLKKGCYRTLRDILKKFNELLDTRT